MRRSRIVGLLALLAGTASGCATATQRGDGLASIRARPESNAPAQRVVAATSTNPAIARTSATSDGHSGIFARPEGLAKFFPGLQKDASETPKVAAKSGTRTTWLGRRLRGIGQGTSTPTSLTYSTAPRPSTGFKTELGETSVLPVSLTLPSDHERDREVTPTAAVADDLQADSADKSAATTESDAAEPQPTTRDSKPSEPSAGMPEVSPPAQDRSQVNAVPTPTIDGATPSPSAEPTGSAGLTGLDAVKPIPPTEPAVSAPEAEAPASRATESDPRERPRLSAPTPRARPVAATAETPRSPAVTKPTRPRTSPESEKDRSASRTAATNTVAAASAQPRPKPRTEDPTALAARAQAETAHILGLPDPTLPSTYYRHNAPPVRGDAAVVATAASVTAPGVSSLDGPCPHCGHDPHWRPSLQRLGRRLLGLGEFAPPYP